MWYIGCGYTHMGPELARNIPSRRSRWTAGLGSGQATIMSEAPRDHHSASWTWFHLLAGPFRFTHASGHRRAFVACNKHVGDCRRYAFISDFPSKHDIGAWMIAWGIIARDFPIEDQRLAHVHHDPSDELVSTILQKQFPPWTWKTQDMTAITLHSKRLKPCIRKSSNYHDHHQWGFMWSRGVSEIMEN